MARLLESHDFQSVAFDFDVREFLSSRRIHDTQRGVRHLNVLAATDNVQKFGRGIIAHCIGIELERNAFEDLVSLPINDPHHPGFPISHINAINIVAVHHGMRFFDAANSLKYFPGSVIKNKESVIILWSGEEPMTFEIDPEVVEPALDFRGQLERLDQRQWLPLVGRSPHGEQNQDYQEHHVRFLHLLSRGICFVSLLPD